MNDKPALTVTRLLESGFTEIDCWLVSEDRLLPPRNLPKQRGVYAFAIDDQVVYVGLASRSLHQRLGFYVRPGASQQTNIRLNEIIRDAARQGQVVRVLIAHPPDLEWNGYRISGSEGLEAALIEDFRPPWNKKGVEGQKLPLIENASSRNSARRARGSVPGAIRDFVAQHPHCTELQIAKGVFGPSAVQPQANQYCRRLVEQGLLERMPTRPATYVVR